jgi:hypothetical protein
MRLLRLTLVAVQKQEVLRILNVRLQPYVSSMQSACTVLLSYILSHSTIVFQVIRKKARFSKKLCNIKRVFWFPLQLSSEIFLLLRRNGQSPTGLHVKYPLFLSELNEPRIFLTDFPKIFNYQIVWKCVQRRPRFSMPVGRQIVMTKLTVAFRNSAKAPINVGTNFSRRQFSPYNVSTNEMNVLI